jgi:hypothetical protein
LYSCPTSRTCAEHSDCGGGHCYGETPERRGTCVDGADGSDCVDVQDCRGGFCGPRGCTSGQPGALCLTEADCAAGKCVGNIATYGFGFCTTGKYNEKCYSDDDCVPELFCHTAATRCFRGELGGACQSDEQCESAICGDGACRTGELGEGCDQDSDCKSGHCVRLDLPMEGVGPWVCAPTSEALDAGSP